MTRLLHLLVLLGHWASTTTTVVARSSSSSRHEDVVDLSNDQASTRSRHVVSLTLDNFFDKTVNKRVFLKFQDPM
jgi:hypothetical protein